MSDDFDDGDVDNDGVPDDQELDSDRVDVFGNEQVLVNGEWLTQMQGYEGTILVDADRHVVATIEPDGDIRMEGGPTYTQYDAFGRDGYVSSQDRGDVIVPVDGLLGTTEYTSESGGDENGGQEVASVGESSGGGQAYVPDSSSGGDYGQYTDDWNNDPVDSLLGQFAPQEGRKAYRDVVRNVKRGVGEDLVLLLFAFFAWEVTAFVGVFFTTLLTSFFLGTPLSLLIVGWGVWMVYGVVSLLWVATGKLLFFIDTKRSGWLTTILLAIMIVSPFLFMLLVI